MPPISEAIKRDHRELVAYYDNIIDAADAEEQVAWQNQFTWELARHSHAEEIVVYPAFEKHVLGGKAMAEKDRGEHQIVKEQLKTFQNLSPADRLFIPTIKTLMNDLTQHIHEEEESDLPKLEDVLTSDESDALYKSFERTKMFVPSRAHPSAPNRPPFETAVGLLTAPVDRVADLFRTWPEDIIIE